MIYLASTRFNNDNWHENYTYKQKHNINGVIYGTNIRIKCTHSVGALFFVIEMNNQTNTIEGIGLIRNQLILDKRYNIYSNGDYNRYIYKGDYWLSREKLLYYDKELVEIFEQILFKSKRHLKRQSGISVVSSLLFEKWDYNDEIIKKDLKEIFIKEFSTTFKTEKDVDLEYEYITVNKNI
jgi:hypothetical protein